MTRTGIISHSYYDPLCIVFILCTFFFYLSANGQVAVDWQNSYGGTGWEELNEIIQTEDEGFLIGGITLSSQNGDISNLNNGFVDYWLLKIDVDGNLIWEKNYGGTDEDRLWSFVPTYDRGILLVGNSNSNIGGDKTQPCVGGMDYWVIKVDSLGNKLWDKTYGGTEHDILYLVTKTKDGNFILAGQSYSNASGDKSENNRGDLDIWVIKIDPLGNKLWDKTYGGNKAERIQGLVESPDGAIVMAIGSASDVGFDKSQPTQGGEDFWILKVDENGNKLWDKRFGGSKEEQPFALRTTLDGGYIVGGSTRSGISGDITSSNLGTALDEYTEIDYWLIKLSEGGNLLWQQRFGGDSLDVLYDIQEDDLGNFFLGGVSNSTTNSIKTDTLFGDVDYWTCYIDKNGNKLWDQTFGGNRYDALTKILRVKGGGYLMGGHSSSPVSGNKTTDTKGLNDFWLVKTACNIRLNLGGDRNVCPSENIFLNASNPQCANCQYYWSNGSTTQSVSFKVEDLEKSDITVVVDEGNLCQLKDTVNINILPTPEIQLGNDTTILDGQFIVLNATSSNSTYWWSTFEKTPTITINYTGYYAVTVTNEYGCASNDSIFIDIKPDANVFVPNAFSPNNDGINDYLQVFADSYVEQVNKFVVYNRWGGSMFVEENFQPNSDLVRWDGTINSRPAPDGVYVYLVEVMLRNNKIKQYTGSVQILR